MPDDLRKARDILGKKVEYTKDNRLIITPASFFNYPLTVSNSGNGPAVNLRIGIRYQTGQMIHNAQPISINSNDSIKLTFISQKTTSKDVGKYVLIFNYYNIFGDNYSQEFEFEIEINEKSQFEYIISFEGNQNKHKKA